MRTGSYVAKAASAQYLWERAMPAISSAHGALPQWIGERPLLLFLQSNQIKPGMKIVNWR